MLCLTLSNCLLHRIWAALYIIRPTQIVGRHPLAVMRENRGSSYYGIVDGSHDLVTSNSINFCLAVVFWRGFF